MYRVVAIVGLIILSMLAAGCAAASAARPTASAVHVWTATPTASPTATALLPSATATATGTPVSTAAPAAAAAGPTVDSAAFHGEGALAFARGGQIDILDGTAGTLTTIAGPPDSSGTARAWSPKWSPDGQWLAFLRLDQPRQFALDGDLWIARRDGRGAHAVVGISGRVGPVGFAWSPTADVVVAAGETAGLWAVSPTGSAHLLAAGATRVWSLAWSADGQMLAYVVTRPDPSPPDRSDVLYTVPAAGGTSTQRLVAKQDGMIMAGQWPNGRGLLFWSDPGHSASLLADGEPLERLTQGSRGVGELTFLGAPSRNLLQMLARPAWVAWAPDEQHFALVVGGGRDALSDKALALCDGQTWTCRLPPRPAGTVSLDPAWSPDGSHLAFVQATASPANVAASDTASWFATHHLWVANADGSGAKELTSAGSGVEAPAWSRDGQHLLYVRDDAVWLVDVTGGAPTRIVDLRANGASPPVENDHGWNDWSLALAWQR